MNLSLKIAMGAACSALLASASSAEGFKVPQPEIVQAQGRYAMVQLTALAAVYGADPSGKASREAFDNGWAPVRLGWSSPSHNWPARGPSLKESIEPLLAQAHAAKMSCETFEGPCQNEAARVAKLQARAILKDKNPGARLAAEVGRLK